MAQPTKQSPSNSLLTIQWVKNANGTPPLIRDYFEGTSEAFVKGDLVLYDQSEDGLVALPNTSGVPTSRVFLGIALADANNVTSGFATIPVLLPQGSDVFSAALASAEGTAVTPTIDDIGQAFGLIKTTSAYDANLPFVLDNAQTNWAKVIDIHPQDRQRLGGESPAVPTLESTTRLLFQFLSAILVVDANQA